MDSIDHSRALQIGMVHELSAANNGPGGRGKQAQTLWNCAATRDVRIRGCVSIRALSIWCAYDQSATIVLSAFDPHRRRAFDRTGGVSLSEGGDWKSEHREVSTR